MNIHTKQVRVMNKFVVHIKHILTIYLSKDYKTEYQY